jgi:hypothetical protein
VAFSRLLGNKGMVLSILLVGVYSNLLSVVSSRLLIREGMVLFLFILLLGKVVFSSLLEGVFSNWLEVVVFLRLLVREGIVLFILLVGKVVFSSLLLVEVF